MNCRRIRYMAAMVGLLLLAGAGRAFAAPQEEARFMASPAISKDKVVFSYEGDLWTVGAEGGVAARLTSFPGEELSPRFSPDGSMIAFIGSYDGSPAVYCMPAEGGVPKRLTYAPSVERVAAWTPDGKRVVFSTMIERITQRDPVLYSVGLDGETAPERLPIDRGSYCSFSPDGRQMAYNRSTYMPENWKRYKGGRHANLWIYEFASNKFTEINGYRGLSAYPMWIGGKIYFVSDQFNGGVANLCAYSLETHDTQPMTHHEDCDIFEPATDGKSIVYLRNGYLNRFDVASGATRQIKVLLPTDHWQMRDRVIDPRPYIHSTNISNSGRLVALEARGDIFTARATGKGQVRNLSKDCASRELFPRISPDGKQVAFFSDRSGEYQLYLQPIEGGPWTQLTTTLKRYPDSPEWSPDGKKILFGVKRLGIYALDVASRQLTTIDEVQTTGTSRFNVGDYSWAPDSNWVCYTDQNENDNSQVFIYSLAQKKKIAVTGDFFDNSSPCFDVNGDYLYFLSCNNFEVRRDVYGDNHIITNPMKVMAVQLRAGQRPPFEDKDDDEDAAEFKAKTGGAAKKKALAPAAHKAAPKATPGAAKPKASADKTTATTHTALLKIDTEGFERRTFPLPVGAGSLSGLCAGKGRVLWFARTEAGSRLHVFDMKEKKDAAIEENVNAYALSANGERILLTIGGDYSVTTLEKLYQTKKGGDRVKLGGMVYRVDTVKEWTQIFNDAWRWYREYFYDAGMHGHDWKGIGERYRAMIPQLTSRARLNRLMLEMVGELCASHSYISGGDLGELKTPAPPVSTGRLGADLAWDEAAGCYRFSRIYGPTPYNLDLKGPLSRPDIKLKEGDWLLAIDGQPLKDRADYHRLLQVTPGQKVKVTVNDKPTTESARTYEVEPIASDRELRYHRWVSDNIRKVLKATDGRVGYMHFRDMSDTTIAEFDKFWRAFHAKEGIIIDVRGNSGGSTEYFLIDKLERQQVGFFVRRDTQPYHYPDQAPVGRHYVAVSNQDNGSCGELFLEHFRACGLGKVVGVNSWGGLIGIYSAMKTVDDGLVNQPNVGFYGRAGRWWIENRGADPDVELDNDPASVMAGRDPQLDKAIEVILAEIDAAKKNPKAGFPPTPAYPRR